jgi:hypothetical protein
MQEHVRAVLEPHVWRVEKSIQRGSLFADENHDEGSIAVVSTGEGSSAGYWHRHCVVGYSFCRSIWVHPACSVANTDPFLRVTGLKLPGRWALMRVFGHSLASAIEALTIWLKDDVYIQEIRD